MSDELKQKLVEKLINNQIRVEYEPIVKIEVSYGIYENYNLYEGFEKIFGIGSYAEFCKLNK